MGQYYNTVVKVGNKLLLADPTDYDSGMKLMEHSYTENTHSIALANLLYKTKLRIAHVGDYADESPLHAIAWGVNLPKLSDDEKGKKSFSYKNKYFINHTKDEYIDFNEYIELSKDSDGYVVSPITLMTALGNGRGGGDYSKDCPNSDMVGHWAWDVVEISDSIPKNSESRLYVKLNVYFKE